MTREEKIKLLIIALGELVGNYNDRESSVSIHFLGNREVQLEDNASFTNIVPTNKGISEALNLINSLD